MNNLDLRGFENPVGLILKMEDMMKKNVITIMVALVLTLSFLSISNAQETIRYHGSATIGKLIMPGASAEFEKLENVKFDIKYKTTGYGIDRLLANECDIAGGAASSGRE